MELKDILKPETILINWKPASKEEAITELVDLLDKSGEISDRESVLQDVFDREESLSTGLEDGIAYPHARSSGVDEVRMAFGIIPDGLTFNSRDDHPAIFVPLMVSPRTGGTPHIYIMAEIVKRLEDQEVREKLLKANSAEEVVEILTE